MSVAIASVAAELVGSPEITPLGIEFIELGSMAIVLDSIDYSNCSLLHSHSPSY